MSDTRTLTIQQPDENELRRAEALLSAAGERQILTADDAAAVGDDLKVVKALAKRLEDQRTAITGPLNQALKEVNALFKPAKDWLTTAEGLLKGKLSAYQSEQQRIAAQEQARLAAEANERRKLLAEAEAIAAEPGGEWAGEILREEARQPIAAAVVSAPAPPAGISSREVWKAEVVDKAEFLRYALAEGGEVLDMVQLDQAKLNSLARAQKGALSLPGIKAVAETTMVVRS